MLGDLHKRYVATSDDTLLRRWERLAKEIAHG